MARRHGVVPLVHRTLSRLSATTMQPDALANLRALTNGIRFHNLVMTGTLHSIFGALDTAGIPAASYKGPALAAFLYQDISLRQFVDIDLLVKPADALSARRVLLRLGYAPTRGMPELALRTYIRLHGEFAFTTEKQILVELNWRIAARYWRLPEIPAAAWQRLRKVTVAGVSVPLFAAEDLLLVLSMHGSKHRWEMLKWIVDIAELLRVCPDMDWNKIMLDAQAGGYQRMLAIGLWLANDLLDAPLPAHVREAVKNKPLVADLAAEVCANLFDVHARPASTIVELGFLARTTERFETKVFCLLLRPLFFLLHRVIRPAMSALRRGVSA